MDYSVNNLFIPWDKESVIEAIKLCRKLTDQIQSTRAYLNGYPNVSSDQSTHHYITTVRNGIYSQFLFRNNLYDYLRNNGYLDYIVSDNKGSYRDLSDFKLLDESSSVLIPCYGIKLQLKSLSKVFTSKFLKQYGKIKISPKDFIHQLCPIPQTPPSKVAESYGMLMFCDKSWTFGVPVIGLRYKVFDSKWIEVFTGNGVYILDSDIHTNFQNKLISHEIQRN